MQKDGRVLYLTESKDKQQYWNIPIANTTVILLGTGTSITQAAARMLASAGIMLGFCGGGGTPLLYGTDVEWLSAQSEYRPTEYIQGWMSFWFNADSRLEAAKYFQTSRIDYLRDIWTKDKELVSEGFSAENDDIRAALARFESRIEQSSSTSKLLQIEAELTKRLYKIAADRTNLSGFTRNREDPGLVNSFLNHGNYLAYGLAACTLWVLGIPHGFAVMHGKTRRGALVFDVADLIKDAIILPLSFICASEGATEQEFRQQCLLAFTKHQSLDIMFEKVKYVALNTSSDA